MRFQIWICSFLLAIILVFSGIRAFSPEISNGQVGKPPFQIDMIRSFQQGTNDGLFPMRRFVELEFSGPILWAEEFPIFTGFVGILSRFLPDSDLVVLSKISVYFSIPLFFLAVLFLISNLKIPVPSRIVLFFIAANLPVVRLYWNHPMPDFWMLIAVVGAWAFALRDRWYAAIFFSGLAMAIKYYAAFSLFSILLFWWIQSPKQFLKQGFKITFLKNIRFLLFVMIVSAPALLYIAYFISHSIPNPIQQYANASGNGHFASGKEWMSLKFYSRLVTWLWVKNPGIIQSALAVLGVIFIFRLNQTVMKRFLLTFTVGQILFILVFSSSFYVHDYYGLQWALLTLVFSFQGYSWIATKFNNEKWQNLALILLPLCLFTEGQIRTDSASKRVSFYPVARHWIFNQTDSKSKGVLLGDRYLAALVYDGDQRVSWIAPFSVLDSTSQEKLLQDRIQNTELSWVGFFHVDTAEGDLRVVKLQKDLLTQGWKLGHRQQFDGAVLQFWTRALY